MTEVIRISGRSLIHLNTALSKELLKQNVCLKAYGFPEGGPCVFFCKMLGGAFKIGWIQGKC